MLSILNEHYLIFTSLIILSFGIIYRFATHLNYPSIQISINTLAIFSLLSILIILVIDTSIPSVLYNSLFVKDASTMLVEIVTVLLSIGIVVTTSKYNKTQNIAHFEYTILLLFVLVSIHLLVAVEELFAFYLILEFQSICLYVLASLKKNKYSIEAALKYFVLGSFASTILLLGFSFIYGVSGLTNYEDLIVFFSNTEVLMPEAINMIKYAIVLTSIGLFFKIYMAPMHLWVADIYAQSPTSSVIIFASTSLMPFYIIFIKLYTQLFGEFYNFWKHIILIICLASIIIGTIGAMYQYSIKRLLAYSSIANAGYIFMSLLTVQSPLLISNGLFYVTIYTINTFGVFVLLLNTKIRTAENKDEYVENIYQLAGLYKKNTVFCLIWMVFFYAIAGLPPFSVFFAKIYLFSSLIYTTTWVWIPIAVALLTVVSAFYYVRIIQIIYFEEENKNFGLHPISESAAYILYMIMLINIFYLLITADTSSIMQYIAIHTII